MVRGAKNMLRGVAVMAASAASGYAPGVALGMRGIGTGAQAMSQAAGAMIAAEVLGKNQAQAADYLRRNPQVMEMGSMMTNTYAAYRGVKGYYDGGTKGAVTGLYGAAGKALSIFGVDADVNYIDNAYDGKQGFSGRLGVGFKMGGFGFGVSSGFTEDGFGGLTANAGIQLGEFNFGFSVSEGGGFGLNAGIAMGKGQPVLGTSYDYNRATGGTIRLNLSGAAQGANFTGGVSYNANNGYGGSLGVSSAIANRLFGEGVPLSMAASVVGSEYGGTRFNSSIRAKVVLGETPQWLSDLSGWLNGRGPLRGNPVPRNKNLGDVLIAMADPRARAGLIAQGVLTAEQLGALEDAMGEGEGIVGLAGEGEFTSNGLSADGGPDSNWALAGADDTKHYNSTNATNRAQAMAMRLHGAKAAGPAAWRRLNAVLESGGTQKDIMQAIHDEFGDADIVAEKYISANLRYMKSRHDAHLAAKARRQFHDGQAREYAMAHGLPGNIKTAAQLINYFEKNGIPRADAVSGGPDVGPSMGEALWDKYKSGMSTILTSGVGIYGHIAAATKRGADGLGMTGTAFGTVVSGMYNGVGALAGMDPMDYLGMKLGIVNQSNLARYQDAKFASDMTEAAGGLFVGGVTSGYGAARGAMGLTRGLMNSSRVFTTVGRNGFRVGARMTPGNMGLGPQVARGVAGNPYAGARFSPAIGGNGSPLSANWKPHAGAGVDNFGAFKQRYGAAFADDVELANGWKVYQQSYKSTDTMVIGRRLDTAVAKEWPRHQILDIQRGWTQNVNRAWVQGGVDRKAPFYLGSPITRNNIWHSIDEAWTVFRQELRQLRAENFRHVGDSYIYRP